MQVIHKYRIVIICLIVAGQFLLFYLGATVKRNLTNGREPAGNPLLKEIADSVPEGSVFSVCEKNDQPDSFFSREREAFQLKAGIRIVF